MSETAKAYEAKAYCGASTREIAIYVHETICTLRRAVDSGARSTPWGMLTPEMQGLVIKCVEQIASHPDMGLLQLLNGFFRNHAKINGKPIPDKRTSLEQFEFDQVLTMNCFLQNARVALFAPRIDEEPVK